MDLQTALLRFRGVARSSALYDLGVRRSQIDLGLQTGTVIRPRRGWIALPEADPDLIGAAKYGVVLSCITQARRKGLWVLDEGPSPHVAARTPQTRTEAPSCKVHWSQPVIPRIPGSLEDPIENVLALIAECQPYESALTIWESALNKQIIDRERLSTLPLRREARRLLADSTQFSDSGLESMVLSRLRWLPERVIPQALVHGHRVDFLIGERLILQIDGGQHVGKQRTSDNRHDALLTLNGYCVIRVGYEQVVRDWPAVQHLVMTAITQGRHLRHTA